jgi:protein-disulfide isomerase
MPPRGFDANVNVQAESGVSMPRALLAIAVLLGVLIGGAAVYLFRAPAPTIDESGIRAIVTEMIAARETELAAKAPMSTAQIDPGVLNPMIEDYLMSDPRILERLSTALETELRTAEAAANKAAIASMKEAIFEDTDHIVLGNPDGDVTLVEMFDYNCTYCRGALPDLATLLAEDPNLRVILKEFPILSKDSVDAARVAVAVSQEDVDYWAFHQALFQVRGQVTGEVALAAAKDLGLNPIELEMRMQSQPITDVIEKSYEIARTLNITGTPTYIIGDEVIPGAVGIGELRARIANMRECGASFCPALESQPS